MTMDAAQGVELIELIRPRAAVPIHYDHYPVFKSRWRSSSSWQRPAAAHVTVLSGPG